MVIMNTH